MTPELGAEGQAGEPRLDGHTHRSERQCPGTAWKEPVPDRRLQGIAIGHEPYDVSPDRFLDIWVNLIAAL